MESRRLSVMNEHGFEVRGAHLSKTAKGGAAASRSFLSAGKNQTWASPSQWGLDPGYGNSVFWSGYKDGALDVARTLGTPISDTTVGSVYEGIVNYLPAPVANAGWNYLSQPYTQVAEGPINIVIGESATGGSVFWQTEFPGLLENSAVTDWAWTLLIW